MTSGKQARKQRQVAARPPVRSTEGRKASPKVVAGVLVGVAVVIAVVAAVLALTGGSSSGSASTVGSTLPDSDVISQQLAGIPQQGNVLGKATAPVTMVEYIDLQCPVCRQFETSTMPTILQRYVRTGKVKVIARPIVVIGPDSETGRRATLAAGLQNKLYNFSQVLYFNQGEENSGWLDDQMVTDAATSVPGLNVQQLQNEQSGSTVLDQAKTDDQQAQADAVAGTPTVLVGKSGGKLASLGAGDPGVDALSAAIENALKQS
jgi:protein-disulfide isomerase